MAGAFDAKVDISTKEAVDGLIALRKEVKLTGESLVALDKIIKDGKQNIVLIAQQFTQLVAVQERAAKAANDIAKADINAARAAGIRSVAEAKVEETLARRATAEARTAQVGTQNGLITARTAEAETRRTIATDKATAATQRASQAQSKMNDGLSNSRYLMYDVGATYGVLAAGLMLIPAATSAVAVAYQKDFAQVLRVTDGLGDGGAKQLKDSLKTMATDMPIAFGELSRITQLGAQMGVANDKLATFTETTAKFVAVTGISADTGATLFGRMESSFTADVQKYPDFFERLGSSIAEVGAKTVATDPEIASMLSQIGPLGAAAGMSAANVTGLAAALASVRVQPELARGTLTRVFGQLNRDAAEGSPKMAEFGKLMGMTGDQATKLWKTDSSTFFTNMIKGLNEAQAKHGELTTTMDKLGIVASRDVSAMTKLAVGYDTLKLSMDSANQGFTDGTALSTMSKITFDTVAAKLTEMGNAWKNFADTIATSGPALQVIGVLIDSVKNFAIGMDHLASKVPVIGVLMNALMGISVITALFLGFKAAQAFVMAGMIGFQQAASRGMAGTLSLSGMTKTLAQTMLQAKGATDAQSKSLLSQVGAMRALAIASSTTSERLAATATVSNNLEATNKRTTSGIRGLGSSLLGLAGGPVGIAIGMLALLAGSFINAGVQAEAAGKAIADGLAQGADQGLRASAEQLGKATVGWMDPIAIGNLGKNLTQISSEAGLGFDKLAAAATKGKDAVAAITPELDKIAQSKGFKDFKEMDNQNGDGAGKLRFLVAKLKEYGDASVTAGEQSKAITNAAPGAAKALTNIGDGSDAGTTSLKKMIKALKDLNDEAFGTINAASHLQSALVKVGEGMGKGNSFNVNNETGRNNIKNVQEALTKARDYYKNLMDTQQATAQQAAQGYTDFTAKLMGDIRTKFGANTSYIDQMAEATTAKFKAAIGGAPVSVPVVVAPAQAAETATSSFNMIQQWYNANEVKAKVGADVSEADKRLSDLANSIASITHLPYSVVLDALTDPASSKSLEVQKLILDITGGTYTAQIGADTTAAVANVQNFVAYARTELAHVQAQMNGGVGLGDGEGSMSPAQKAQYGEITTRAAAPAQVRTQVQPLQPLPASVAPSLDNVSNGYKKVQDEANKAGKATKGAGAAAKEAAKDFASGISEAVQSAADYGNRLKTALMSAYTQQYALTSATDSYHSALNAITKKRADEIKQVTDLRDKIKQLNDERSKELITANKAKIEQGISLKYGEGARAADYGNQAQIALNNAAAKQKEIDVATKQAATIQDGIGNLTGYSDAAIANRAALRGLETKMIDMVAAYATLGHSSEEVRRYAQGLTAQYKTDVGQMGYNNTAVNTLQGSFQRYIDTINRVPQVVPTTATANTTAAQQKFNDLNGAIDALQQPVVIPIDANTAAMEWHVAEALARVQANLQKTLTDPTGTGSGIGGRLNGSLMGGMYQGGSVRGFASGGMVPGTPPSDRRADNMMAQVDGKGLIKIRSREFIQPQEAVDYYGPDFMEAIRTMSLPKFNMGGSVGGGGGGSSVVSQSVVDLSAATLASLADMRQEIRLFADTRELASSVNAGNRQLAAEGHRS